MVAVRDRAALDVHLWPDFWGNDMARGKGKDGGLLSVKTGGGQGGGQGGVPSGLLGPSIQSFGGMDDASSIGDAFARSLMYQANLPGMIRPFSQADIPTLNMYRPTEYQRLDVANVYVPNFLRVKTPEEAAALGSGSGGLTNTSTTGNQTAATPMWLMDAYNQYLGRSVAEDRPGLDYWLGQYNSGQSSSDIINLIKNSPEALRYLASRPVTPAPVDPTAGPSSDYY